jgi:hypothetical protein
MPRLNSRQKRQARFAAAQGRLTSEELETQKQQNMEVTQRPLAHSTLYLLKLSKKWFVEFLEDQVREDIELQRMYIAALNRMVGKPDHAIQGLFFHRGVQNRKQQFNFCIYQEGHLAEYREAYGICAHISLHE